MRVARPKEQNPLEDALGTSLQFSICSNGNHNIEH